MRIKIITFYILINFIFFVKVVESQDWTPVTLYTPKNTPVAALIPNVPITEKEYSDAMVEVNRYQNIDILEYPTNAYNCHGCMVDGFG